MHRTTTDSGDSTNMWKSTPNLGHFLNFGLLVIAYLALSSQRESVKIQQRELQAKVADVEALTRQLRDESVAREDLAERYRKGSLQQISRAEQVHRNFKTDVFSLFELIELQLQVETDISSELASLSNDDQFSVPSRKMLASLLLEDRRCSSKVQEVVQSLLSKLRF